MRSAYMIGTSVMKELNPTKNCQKLTKRSQNWSEIGYNLLKTNQS